jgi:hypothetical protein
MPLMVDYYLRLSSSMELAIIAAPKIDDITTPAGLVRLARHLHR